MDVKVAGDAKQWPAEWMRGVLPLCVLAIIAEETTYGYAIAQRLHAAGLGTVKGGTLYPILARLEEDGLVTSAWRDGDGGPGRKFFSITPVGRDALRQRAGEWAGFAASATALMTRQGVTA